MDLSNIKHLIRTYNNYSNPQEVLEQYQVIMQELELKQGVSSYRLANRTGAPRGFLDN